MIVLCSCIWVLQLHYIIIYSICSLLKTTILLKRPTQKGAMLVSALWQVEGINNASTHRSNGQTSLHQCAFNSMVMALHHCFKYLLLNTGEFVFYKSICNLKIPFYYSYILLCLKCHKTLSIHRFIHQLFSLWMFLGWSPGKPIVTVSVR